MFVRESGGALFYVRVRCRFFHLTLDNSMDYSMVIEAMSKIWWLALQIPIPPNTKKSEGQGIVLGESSQPPVSPPTPVLGHRL